MRTLFPCAALVGALALGCAYLTWHHDQDQTRNAPVLLAQNAIEFGGGAGINPGRGPGTVPGQRSTKLGPTAGSEPLPGGITMGNPGTGGTGVGTPGITTPPGLRPGTETQTGYPRSNPAASINSPANRGVNGRGTPTGNPGTGGTGVGTTGAGSSTQGGGGR